LPSGLVERSRRHTRSAPNSSTQRFAHAAGSLTASPNGRTATSISSEVSSTTSPAMSCLFPNPSYERKGIPVSPPMDNTFLSPSSAVDAPSSTVPTLPDHFSLGTGTSTIGTIPSSL